MSARKPATEAKEGKRLGLGKKTVRDLTMSNAGVKGGLIMKDTNVVRTSTR
jgi:hypothetical protein